MRFTGMFGTVAGALGCLAFAGCLGSEQDGATNDAINTTPASLAEGQAEMAKIDRIMAQSGSTDALVQKERLIRDRMDTLSGLVDRIDVAADHTINFFALPDGSAVVSERMKIGTPSSMKPSESIASIYARLAPGRAIPVALTKPALAEAVVPDTNPSQPARELAAPAAAPAALADGVEVATSALTASAEDDQWFRDNACPAGNVAQYCFIHASLPRAVSATSDHSLTNVAFTRGTGSINLDWGTGPSGSPVTWSVSVLPGEFQWYWWVGPRRDVSSAFCLPLLACPTQVEAVPRTTFWAISGTQSGKSYDWGVKFYNNPIAVNQP